METEYTVMRQEITARLQILHQQLNLATTLLMASLLFGVFFWGIQASFSNVETFLLTLPIIFACLTFNYQANQMTMEAVANYLRDHCVNKEVAAGWENYYCSRKEGVQLISFLKVLPLFVPQLLPIILIAWHGTWPVSGIDQILTSIDLALFALVIFNFRYKFKR